MRVLFISYWFPPAVSAASNRAQNFAKILTQCGHDVFVVSSTYEGPFKEYREEMLSELREIGLVKQVKKLLSLCPRPFERSILNIFQTCWPLPDRHILWCLRAVWLARKIIHKTTIDVVYASCPPFSTLMAARYISHTSKIPWVAEFRDLWAYNHSYNLPTWRKNWDEKQEYKITLSASALVTVSKPLAHSLSKLHHQPIWVINNGADFNKKILGCYNHYKPNTLVLAYTGTIYYEHYYWKELLECIRIMRNAGIKLKVFLAGRNLDLFVRYAIDLGLKETIVFKGPVSQEETISIQNYADCLIFFTWKNTKGIRTSKLAEYIASGRPILMLGSATDISDIVEKLGMGSIAENAYEASSYLLEHVSKKLECSGRVPDIELEDISEFSSDYQFKKLERKLAEFLSV